MAGKLTRSGRRVLLSFKSSEDTALELDRARGDRTRSECLNEALLMWLAARKRWVRLGVEASMAGRRGQASRDAQAGVTPLHGVQPGDERMGEVDPDWEPAYPGQRPPFGRGNTLGRTHGASSENVVGPLAEAIEAEILSDAQMPQHVRSVPFRRSVRASSRAEAVAEILFGYIAELTPEQMTIPRKAGTKAPLDLYLSAEAKAAGHRARLGLDPVSYARIAKDLGLAHAASEQALEKLAGQGAEVTRRAEIEASRDFDPARQPERPPPG
jgi:hypothetical protein